MNVLGDGVVGFQNNVLSVKSSKRALGESRSVLHKELGRKLYFYDN